jgi:hypothetical protein
MSRLHAIHHRPLALAPGHTLGCLEPDLSQEHHA